MKIVKRFVEVPELQGWQEKLLIQKRQELIKQLDESEMLSREYIEARSEKIGLETGVIFCGYEFVE